MDVQLSAISEGLVDQHIQKVSGHLIACECKLVAVHFRPFQSNELTSMTRVLPWLKRMFKLHAVSDTPVSMTPCTRGPLRLGRRWQGHTGSGYEYVSKDMHGASRSMTTMTPRVVSSCRGRGIQDRLPDWERQAWVWLPHRARVLLHWERPISVPLFIITLGYLTPVLTLSNYHQSLFYDHDGRDRSAMRVSITSWTDGTFFGGVTSKEEEEVCERSGASASIAIY